MNDNLDLGIAFDLPKNQSNVIKVIGVGGGGSNAINHMFKQGIKGVDFVICNTDAQALNNSGVPNKIQLGINLTEGLGAGANPEIGSKAALESAEDIKNMLNVNTKMVFITAGMGGGTGTGAAPVIAQMAKEMDILTVGIVTMPFSFEGKIRNDQAQIGIETLREHVDSLVVINNNKLRDVYGNLGFKAGFSKADEVLSTASKGIAEVITHHYTQNIDLRDAKTVLSNSGTAIMGSATSSGSNRAQEAIMKALDSPLLNDNKITGAKNVLLLIVSGNEEITIDEIGEINDHIQEQAGHGANIIMGVGDDSLLEDSISVTIIATGFNIDQQDEISNTEAKKVIHTLEDDNNLFSQKSELKETKEIILENSNNEKIVHVLEQDEPIANEDILVTNDNIKSIEVNAFELVTNEVIDTEDETNLIQNDMEDTVEEDFSPTFDWSLFDDTSSEVQNNEIENEAQIQGESLIDINEIEVVDFIELVSTEESNSDGETIHELNDHIVIEPLLKENSEDLEIDVLVEEESQMELINRDSIFKEESTNMVNEERVIDPLNSPIADLQLQRSKERRLKMKEFNYKFNNSKIDEIEKEPAYKRLGIDLDEVNHSSENNESRLTLNLDENEDIQLRTNNSFLHDNVD
ncbi:MAG: cell division protein FtsZ [Flavobacteriales bacterium]|jgi:cell division protein FtsZ|tara:strand:+ start:15136 stop:17040 length:1905 start_codon:yes stop_codon:yes gene_type:complete